MKNFDWRIGHVIAVFSVVVIMPLLSSCGVYLHDDNLQKHTDSSLNTYKNADIVATMKSALDAQKQLDKTELQSILEKETADRERAIKDLISTYPETRTEPPKRAIDRLIYRVDGRIKQLVGNTFDTFHPKDWLNNHEKIFDISSTTDALQREMDRLLIDYRADGGKNFRSCESFQVTDNESTDELKNKAQSLKDKCDGLELNSSVTKLQKLKDIVINANGEIANVNKQLAEVEKKIKVQNKSKSDTDKTLNDLKKVLEAAKTKDPNSINTEVNAAIKNLDSAIKNIDEATGFVGTKDSSLGATLAAIQFKKTSLRDIIAASSLPTTGGTTVTPATDINRAIVGVIVGLIEVSNTSNPPSIPELSVSLAFQDGLEKQVQAMLDALDEKRRILQDQQDSLLHELELLAVASDASQAAISNLKSVSCNPIGFADLFPNANCSSATRMAAARALSSYNLSWASGRTAARLDDYKITQQIIWQKLRVAQETAVARTNIQTIALNEVAAFGQGGIKPETIAAFLQAIGVAVIAGGVY